MDVLETCVVRSYSAKLKYVKYFSHKYFIKYLNSHYYLALFNSDLRYVNIHMKISWTH